MHFRIFARQLWPYFGFVFTLLLLNGCQQIPQTNRKCSRFSQTCLGNNQSTYAIANPASYSHCHRFSRWFRKSLRPGLAARNMPVMGNSGERLATLSILRLEPQAFRFAVGYIGESNQSLPLSLSEWQTEPSLVGGQWRLLPYFRNTTVFIEWLDNCQRTGVW